MTQQFSALQEKFFTWFQGLSESEQKLLKIASVTFLIFVVYLTVSSVLSGVSESQNKLKQQQQLNDWAKQQIAIIQQSKRSGSTQKSAGSMTQLINSAARKHNISIARLQPQKDDLVKVGLDDIGFNRLVAWLQELNTRHGVRVENIDFAKSDEVGKVTVRRLDLTRG